MKKFSKLSSLIMGGIFTTALLVSCQTIGRTGQNGEFSKILSAAASLDSDQVVQQLGEIPSADSGTIKINGGNYQIQPIFELSAHGKYLGVVYDYKNHPEKSYVSIYDLNLPEPGDDQEGYNHKDGPDFMNKPQVKEMLRIDPVTIQGTLVVPTDISWGPSDGDLMIRMRKSENEFGDWCQFDLAQKDFAPEGKQHLTQVPKLDDGDDVSEEDAQKMWAFWTMEGKIIYGFGPSADSSLRDHYEPTGPIGFAGVYWTNASFFVGESGQEGRWENYLIFLEPYSRAPALSLPAHVFSNGKLVDDLAVRGACRNALFIENQDSFQIAINGRLPVSTTGGYHQYGIEKIEFPHRKLVDLLVKEPTIGADFFEYMVFAVQGTSDDDKSIQVYLLRFREGSIFPTREAK